MKFLIQIPYYLLLVAIFLMGLLLVATMAPIPGNFSVKIVKSGSMEPSIKTGGIVVIKSVGSYVVGDVITFGQDSKTQIPTTHRIVESKVENRQTFFTTKGDANDSVDPLPVKSRDIQGKVFLTLPYVGFILDFAKKPLGFVLIVCIPALLVIIDEIGNIWRELKRIRKNRSQEKPMKRLVSLSTNTHDQYRGMSNVLDLRVKRTITPRRSYAGQVFVWLAIFGTLSGFSSVGSTVSYYRQEEVSKSNTLQASAFYPNSEVAILTSNEEIISATVSTEATENSEDEIIEDVMEEVVTSDASQEEKTVEEGVEVEELKEVENVEEVVVIVEDTQSVTDEE